MTNMIKKIMLCIFHLLINNFILERKGISGLINLYCFNKKRSLTLCISYTKK